MDQAGKERLVKSRLNYCMDFGNLFFINTGPIRTLANPFNTVILNQTKTAKDTTDVMDTFYCLQLKTLKVLENGTLLGNLWILDKLLARRTVKNNEYSQGLPNDCLNTFLHTQKGNLFRFKRKPMYVPCSKTSHHIYYILTYSMEQSPS